MGCGRASFSGSVRKCFCVETLLRDGALCPGDRNMGMSPRSHTRSPLAQPSVLNGIQTQDCCCPVSPFLRDLLSCSPVPPLHPHSRSRPGRGGGDTVGWGGARVCSPPKLASRAKRKSEERKWNAHQPSNRGGFLSLRLLTKSPQLTSHSWWKTEAFPVRSGARHGHLLSPLLIHTILEVLSEQLGQKRKQKHTNWKNCAISKS